MYVPLLVASVWSNFKTRFFDLRSFHKASTLEPLRWSILALSGMFYCSSLMLWQLFRNRGFVRLMQKFWFTGTKCLTSSLRIWCDQSIFKPCSNFSLSSLPSLPPYVCRLRNQGPSNEPKWFPPHTRQNLEILLSIHNRRKLMQQRGWKFSKLNIRRVGNKGPTLLKPWKAPHSDFIHP